MEGIDTTVFKTNNNFSLMISRYMMPSMTMMTMPNMAIYMMPMMAMMMRD